MNVRTTALRLTVVTATLIAAWVAPASAYLKLGLAINGQQTALKWAQMPVRYFVENQGVAGVAASDFQAAVARSFASWQALPTASIAYQSAGLTAAVAGNFDGQTTLGFVNRPDLDRVLATTSFIVDTTTGAIVESDIIFNSSFAWSVAPGGETGKYDVESIALHEIGHLSGLSHSALGETELRSDGTRRVISSGAVMFPIAFAPGSTTSRTLRADDIAGMSDIYPDGGVSTSTGSISGRVTKNGAGVFGAHVVAFDLANGTMVGNFTLNAQGAFSIAGLLPGPHLVRVEPLDDASTDSFFDGTVPIDVDFTVAFFERLVVVPSGGDSGAIEVKVVRK